MGASHVRLLSTGDPSTLGSYLKWCSLLFGEKSAAVEFLKKKAADDPDGLEAEVIADEGQAILLLYNIHARAIGERHGKLS